MNVAACTLIVFGLLSLPGRADARDSGGLGCRPPPSNAPADTHRRYIQCVNAGQPQAAKGPVKEEAPSTRSAEGQNVGLARSYVDCVTKQKRAKKTEAQAKIACEGLKP